MRQGVEPRGIIASGYATSHQFEEGHFTDSDALSNYVKIRWDAILHAERDAIIPRRTLLDDSVLSDTHWDTQSSGIEIPSVAAARLEAVWKQHTSTWTFAKTESPLWLNVDKPVKSLVLHFRGGCSDEARKGRGAHKPVGEIGRDGGWLPFADYSAALRYSQREWPNFPSLRYCSNCASAVSLADLEDEQADEGSRALVTHRRIERSLKLVASKRRAVLKATGGLACEICSFDFLQFYGPIGLEFCEVHHLKPLAELTGKHTTTLADLAVVCSNCHRMLHRGRPCFTPDELKKQIRKP